MREGYNQARQEKNYKALGEAVNQQLMLETDRQKLSESLEQKVLDVLKTDQLARWIGQRMTTEVTSRLARLKLTDQQILRIQQWSTQQAGQLLQAGQNAEQTRRQLDKKADRHIRQEILTEAQLEMLKPKRRVDAETARQAEKQRREEKSKKDATNSVSRESDGRSGASRKR